MIFPDVWKVGCFFFQGTKLLLAMYKRKRNGKEVSGIGGIIYKSVFGEFLRNAKFEALYEVDGITDSMGRV